MSRLPSKYRNAGSTCRNNDDIFVAADLGLDVPRCTGSRGPLVILIQALVM
jgi:hypothetical protein